MARVISAFSQFFDGNGDPLVNGWLHFLVSGTNNTDKNTYCDVSETIPNTNPVQLDAEGRCPNVFGTGSYRVVSYTNDPVLDSPNVQIQQFDPVPGLTDSGSNWTDWIASRVYAIGSIVIADDGLYYKSLIANNTNVNPDGGANPESWLQVGFLYAWNEYAAFSVSEAIVFSDGVFYTCLVDTLAGESPTTNPEKWLGPVPVSLVLLLTQQADANSSIVFSPAYVTDEYEQYILRFDDVILSEASNIWFQMQIGGVTQTGSQDYDYHQQNLNAATTTQQSFASTTFSKIEIRPANTYGVAAGMSVSGEITVSNPSSENYTSTNFFGCGYDSAQLSLNGFQGAGALMLTSAVDGFVISPSAGTITSGSFKLYGVLK